MADTIKLESFKLITLEEFKDWEGFDKLVAQYGKKLYDDNISNYLIEGIVRASLQLDSICGYRLESEFPLLDSNSEIDKKRINYVKIACCLQTQYLIRTGIEYSSGGENGSDGVASYTYPSNMKIEFSPDVISLLEKAKFYKSQTITKINPDNYGFKNENHTWFGRPDTNHKDRPILLSEADAKYVWKNSMFKSNTLSIIPWADTGKGGIWQIEVSPEQITKIVDVYFKNVKLPDSSKILARLDLGNDNQLKYKDNTQFTNPNDLINKAYADNNQQIIWEEFSKKIQQIKNDLDEIQNNLNVIKWEIIDTSDFVTNIEYKIKNFDINYTYQIYTGSSSSNAGTIISIPNFKGFILQAISLFQNQICNIQLSDNGEVMFLKNDQPINMEFIKIRRRK